MRPQLQLISEDERHIDRFLDQLDKACTMLDTLAQLQALVGTVMMQNRAGHTEELTASLKSYGAMLRAAHLVR